MIGQLSHNVRGSPDDQVYYGYALENGVLKPDSLKIRIKEGGWGNVAGVVGSAVGAYLGVPIPPDAGKKFWRQASKVVGGKGWPDVAPLLITSIAVYHASAVQRSLRIRDHRSHKSN